jgi:hypothetical protein
MGGGKRNQTALDAFARRSTHGGTTLAKAEAIQKRLQTLEDTQMRYRGTWAVDRQYSVGSVVTWDGSAWHAALPTKGERPGSGGAWRLMVKRGSDAAKESEKK